ncbi:MAG: DNA-directed DNA polymerase epsilon, subunit B [Cirrosporium novae-zelandiae]|nr:MAG: DNA-directed DNA polymerase epsilon, subunit B [Cirrosporium novae-zelandiae]
MNRSIFKSAAASPNPIPSSSPGFGTPVHPINLSRKNAAPKRPVAQTLPILLPPATLRPIAFRTFTKKHGLTLNSSALQALATFIGTHCGSGWRDEGLAEKVLEEAAKTWKKNGGGVIVDGDSDELKNILKMLEGCMVGGKVILGRQNSFTTNGDKKGSPIKQNDRPGLSSREDNQSSFGISKLGMDNENEGEAIMDPRKWLKVITAFEQPRLVYNVGKKRFERSSAKPSLLPSPAHKTQLFRNRYNIIHQRLLRNESFQVPTFATERASLQRSSSTLATTQQAYRITPIANLLGRGGSTHLLLGMLIRIPTGDLAISDLSGSIVLDLVDAKPVPENGAWFAPGMIVLIDGIYEEEENVYASTLAGGDGVGGIIGGKFIAFSVGGPPCERREVTLGISGKSGEGDFVSGGGFGWVDFLGLGSERAQGSRMRRIEKRVLQERGSFDEEADNEGRGRIIIMSEINLDVPKTLEALKRVLAMYDAEPAGSSPMTFILIGNFVQYAVLASGGSGGSVEYKEYFDSLASTLSEFPDILQVSTFIFVPGDNDPWPSAFSSGTATILPRKGVPDLFTSRIKRAFATANAEASKGQKTDGEAIWATNPARLSIFGPSQELVLFRDNISGRLRRNAIAFKAVEQQPEGTGSSSHANESQYSAEASNDMEIDALAAEAQCQLPSVSFKDPTRQVSTTTIDQATLTARKLVKTVLDQGYLSPFPLSVRPVLWDYMSALNIYPLPTALVLADPEAPSFAVTYEGCHVMNPGRLVVEGMRDTARWVEYGCKERRGRVREVNFR